MCSLREAHGSRQGGQVSETIKFWTQYNAQQVFLREAKRIVVDHEGQGFREDNEWVLDTEGTNLLEVRFPVSKAQTPVSLFRKRRPLAILHYHKT